MLTFTYIGGTRQSIRGSLQHVIRDLRKRGYDIQYWGVVELHKSGEPHMHLVQRGSYIPKSAVAWACTKNGWGFSDIRAVTSGWSATRYCAKHLCHSHGRRWDGRLIRYSRQFFPETKKARKERLGDANWQWEMMFGRADHVASQMSDIGLTVEVGEMGLDWIQGEARVGDDIEIKYARDVAKGYVEERSFFESASKGRYVKRKFTDKGA